MWCFFVQIDPDYNTGHARDVFDLKSAPPSGVSESTQIQSDSVFTFRLTRVILDALHGGVCDVNHTVLFLVPCKWHQCQ
jgi:hypothetical protein